LHHYLTYFPWVYWGKSNKLYFQGIEVWSTNLKPMEVPVICSEAVLATVDDDTGEVFDLGLINELLVRVAEAVVILLLEV
jgi:hypothetical protein